MPLLPTRMSRTWALISALLVSASAGACSNADPVVDGLCCDPPTPALDSVAPVLDRTVYASGLSTPWDLGFLPNGEMLFTERGGRVGLRRTNGTIITVAQLSDVVVSGEGGLLGLAIDPAFSTNRFVYTCLSSNRGGTNDNRLVRWALSADGTSLTDWNDILTGLPWANGGRHSGCRPRFAYDTYLWVGTGDAAVGTNAQNLTSLGGKVLRITRDGSAAPDNPTIAGADARIYSYGHRNVQGIAPHPTGAGVYSVEHGPAYDDEVNRLVPGGNAGWNPVPGYNESVSMTDLAKYPNAVKAFYSTGSPAKGSSGGTFITGKAWRSYENAFAITQLVGARLLLLVPGNSARVQDTIPLYGNLNTRLRVPVMGPDGALYVATDVGNGGGQVWRIAPRN